MVNIFNEDCVLGMQNRLTAGEIDCIITSPPYNLGINYGTYDDHISRKKYLDWMVDVTHEMSRVLSDTGSLFLNLGSKPTDPWVPYDVLNVFRRSFELQNTFIWVKAITIDSIGKSFGHFKPLNSKRFVNDCFEYVFHFSKSGNVLLDRLAIGVEYSDKSNVKRWDSVKTDLRCRGNVWFCPYETIQNHDKDRPHPATFPVQLVKNCLLVHGKDRIRLALDPFLGLGSSAEAANDLGLNFIGFEIDSAYCEEAKRKFV